MPTRERVDVAIVGSGIAGLAAACYLTRRLRHARVALVDHRPPMSHTSARSGDNYRNWWPHPVMTAFTDLSIDLMETIARETQNAIAMTRRGYLLATRRRDTAAVVEELRKVYQDELRHPIRVHERNDRYIADAPEDWAEAPSGVDVLAGNRLIRRFWPALGKEIRTVIHIRRAGDIDGQSLGRNLLEGFVRNGGRRLCGRLVGADVGGGFTLAIESGEGRLNLDCERVVIAAGPDIAAVAALFDLDLDVINVFQQKIAFPDVLGAVPRLQPFTIDLDAHRLDWSAEESSQFGDDPSLVWLTRQLPGGIHCRPDGGSGSNRIKLGWALNAEPGEPTDDLDADPAGYDFFPEIVLRAAAGLQPALSAYVDSPPRQLAHYGGYYTMTPENWPLIGPTAADGLFVVGALSGFGTMAACAAGSIVADWMTGREIPVWAKSLSAGRYEDAALMQELRSRTDRGIL